MQRISSEAVATDEPSQVDTDEVNHQQVVLVVPKRVMGNRSDSDTVECVICGDTMSLVDLVNHQKTTHSNIKNILPQLNAIASSWKRATSIRMVRCKFCNNTMPRSSLEKHQSKKHSTEFIRMQMLRPYVSNARTRPTHLPIGSIRPFFAVNISSNKKKNY